MTASVNLTLDAGKDSVRLTGGGADLVATVESLTSRGSVKEEWSAGAITEISSREEGGSFVMQVVTEDGGTEIIRTRDQRDLLRGMEAIAAILRVRLVEHTGRWVEADEHGMSVLEQIASFPDRWPGHREDDLKMLDVARIGGIVQFTIPSELERRSLFFFSTVCLFSLPIGISLASSETSWLMNTMTSLGPLVVVLAVGAMLAMQRNMLVSKHTIALGRKSIHVRPRYLGIVGLPSREFTLDEFKDLDVSSGGRITFLFGEERISCVMEDDLQADWVLAEIVDALGGFDVMAEAYFDQEE